MDHQLMAITLSKPNRFSKFFHYGETEEIVHKTHIIIAHHTQSIIIIIILFARETIQIQYNKV